VSAEGAPEPRFRALLPRAPEGSETITAQEALADWREQEGPLPRVALNMVASLDGRIAVGGRSAPLNFRRINVLFGERIKLDAPGGQPVDLGYVGHVTRVDRTTIDNFCYAGIVPVIPSMCLDAEGEKLNVNADTAATAVAQALGAEKLVFLSDVNGVRRNRHDPGSLIDSLTADEARKLLASGAVEAGMIPKVEACLETLDKGVRKIHIIDGRQRHSLLLEVYTSKGVGTEIFGSR